MNIKEINTQKTLSPTQISLADYVINPYRGCEFGCFYCYSQENKNIKDIDFSNTLAVKINAPEILAKELKYTKPKMVLLGSTCECFQYAEIKYKITEKILNILNSYNIPVTILTKSHLIKDYLEIITRNPNNKVYFTLNFHNQSLINAFEKASSPLAARLETLKEILNHNINLRIHIGPYIPQVCEFENITAILPKEVKEIDIELYHYKMGNFLKILEITENTLGHEQMQNLQNVYKNKDLYLNYASQLKEKIKSSTFYQKHKVFYIVPDYDKFYSPMINYEKTIL